MSKMLPRAAASLSVVAVLVLPVVATAGDDARETTAQVTALANARADRDGRVRVFTGSDVRVLAVNSRAYVRGQAVSRTDPFALCKESARGLSDCLPIQDAGDANGFECNADIGPVDVIHSCACTDTEDCIAMIRSGSCIGHEMNCTENACTCDHEFPLP